MEFKFREDGSGYFEPYASIFEAMVECDLIAKTGGWYEFEGTKLQKNKMIEHLKAFEIIELAKLIGAPVIEPPKASAEVEEEEEVGDFS